MTCSFVLLFIIFTYFDPVFNRVDVLHPDERQKDVLHETIRNLLKIDQEPESDETGWRANTKSHRAASKYMRRLFEKYSNHEIKDPGSEEKTRTVVRAITPRIGRFQDRDALLFDLQSINISEVLIKAEVHYYAGNHRAHHDAKQVKPVHCYSLTRVTTTGKAIRGGDIELPMIEASANDEQRQKWLVFDALDAVNSTSGRLAPTDSNGSTDSVLAIMFARSAGTNDHRRRVSPIQKIVRIHAPFLLISTRDTIGLSMNADQIDDGDEEEEDDRSDQTIDKKRRRRQVDSKYYEYYHPFETPYTTSPNDVGFKHWKESEEKEAATGSTLLQRGPSVLRRQGEGQSRSGRGRRKHRRWGSTGRKQLDDDYEGVWHPMEKEERKGGKNRNKYGKVLRSKDERDPTAVVLLEDKADGSATSTCQRNDLVVDFHDIGWGEYVIAPSSFEAHYCAGSCTFPVPQTVNATNHAIVLDIIQKIRLHPQIPKPCCAPDKMDSLSLLYYDANGNVVLTTYPKMSVVSCACL